jgi:hypothetical protein
VTVVINDQVMKEPLEPGSENWGIGSRDFSAIASVPTYVSSTVRPSLYYPYTNNSGFFSFAMNDGTTYMRSWPSVYSNSPDNGVDVVEFFYPSSGAVPITVGQLADRLRQPSTTGRYHADLGDVSNPLYIDIAFASPRVVPLPATVWLGFGAMGALFVVARRRERRRVETLRTS